MRDLFIPSLLLAATACASSAPQAASAANAAEVSTGARAAADGEPIAAPSSCTRHADCSLVSDNLLFTGCRGATHSVAVQATALPALWAAHDGQCGPPPDPCSCGPGRPATCCPPGGAMWRDAGPTEHAACVQQQCVVRTGGALTRDEAREDAAGTGTAVDSGQCYADGDCGPGPWLTAFPLGDRNARGDEVCPVCPRPGTPLVDEAARIARLTEACPQRVCMPDLPPMCDHRTCVGPPPRPPRVPVAADWLPQEPEPPPDLPALPDDPDARCSTRAGCQVAELCGTPIVVSTRQLARMRLEERTAGNRPCAARDPNVEPPPVPDCVEGFCAEATLGPARAEARRQQAKLGPAHAAWERTVARMLAARERAAEVERAP